MCASGKTTEYDCSHLDSRASISAAKLLGILMETCHGQTATGTKESQGVTGPALTCPFGQSRDAAICYLGIARVAPWSKRKFELNEPLRGWLASGEAWRSGRVLGADSMPLAAVRTTE